VRPYNWLHNHAWHKHGARNEHGTRHKHSLRNQDATRGKCRGNPDYDTGILDEHAKLDHRWLK